MNGWMLTCIGKALWVIERLEKRNVNTVHLPIYLCRSISYFVIEFLAAFLLMLHFFWVLCPCLSNFAKTNRWCRVKTLWIIVKQSNISLVTLKNSNFLFGLWFRFQDNGHHVTKVLVICNLSKFEFNWALYFASLPSSCRICQ